MTQTPDDGPETTGGPQPSVPRDFDRLGDLLGDVCEVPGGREAPGAPRPVRGPRPRRAGVVPVVSAAAASDPARRVALVWPEAVGTEVAANARPVQLRNGRLTVSVSSSAWAQTLQFLSEAITVRLNEKLGEEVVESVVFRHAGWEERLRRDSGPEPAADTGRPAASPRLSADQREALAQVAALDLPAGLRERITQAMEAAFVRGGPDSVR